MNQKDKHIESAYKHVSKGNYDNAIDEYLKILEEDPKDHKAYYALGELYLKSNKNKEAIINLSKAAALFCRDGFYNKAKSIYEKILTIDDKIIEAREDLADVCQKTGNLNISITQFMLAAEGYEKIGKHDEASQMLQKAIIVEDSLKILKDQENIKGIVESLKKLNQSDGIYMKINPRTGYPI